MSKHTHQKRPRKKPSKVGTVFCFSLSVLGLLFQLLAFMGSRVSSYTPYQLPEFRSLTEFLFWWGSTHLLASLSILFLILGISDIVIRRRWVDTPPSGEPEVILYHSANFSPDPTSPGYIICDICNSKQEDSRTRCDKCGAPFGKSEV